ncbi:uncharacterized protein [Typha angustifolia]|uniref:uncharacterized protein n=1 Tax=Typha angustifolia TaxID=59011 RepID=UPI003C2E19C7
MGNCQAAEAATVVIQHPGGKIERVYWSLSARHVMAANPGHYVAVIITAPSSSGSSNNNNNNNNNRSNAPTSNAPVKHLKLLRPDDTLLIGHVYRLVSFEEVLKEFASKKHVKVNRLVVKHKVSERDRILQAERSRGTGEAMEEREKEVGSNDNNPCSRAPPRPGQWKPALQSIAEGIGS